MNEPNDAEQHGSIVNLVFCFFVIVIVLIVIVGLGGPG